MTTAGTRSRSTRAPAETAGRPPSDPPGCTPPPTSAALRRARRTAAILHWRRAGASMAVIARGLGIGVGTVHRTLADIRRRTLSTQTEENE